MKHRDKDNVLDHKECNEIVRKKLIQDSMNDYALINYEIIPMDSTTGYMGQYFILKAVVSPSSSPIDEKIVKFFIKLPPAKNAPLNGVNMEQGSFRKEVDIYTKVFPAVLTEDIDMCIPKCFLGLDDSIIVLEDMSSRGYIMTDKYIPFDFDHCEIMMKTLAKFHAKSLIFEELYKKNIMTEFSYCLHETLWPTREGFAKKLLKAGIIGVSSMIDLLTHIDEDNRNKFKMKFQEIAANHAENLKPSKKFRNVICHGDLWTNNILVKYDDDGMPISCSLIDFQLVRYNPPAHDIMCFLYFTTTRQFRINHSKQLYQIYYNQLAYSLQDAGLNHVDIISSDDFYNSIEELNLAHKIHGTLNLNMMLLSPQLIAKYSDQSSTIEGGLFVDRTPIICPHFQEMKEYRERMTEILQDVFDELMLD